MGELNNWGRIQSFLADSPTKSEQQTLSLAFLLFIFGDFCSFPVGQLKIFIKDKNVREREKEQKERAEVNVVLSLPMANN